MFYAHELLTSEQYGVATVWLLATVGSRSHGKRISRKAIQQVNVRQVASKIIDPGVPMALRLQGNLLYGLSRVYSQQCTYVVIDAEKVRDDMRILFRVSFMNQLDPEAGQTKRQNIIVPNDPAFDPLAPLPELDLEIIQELLVASQNSSTENYSFLTPLDQDSLSSRRGGSFGDNIAVTFSPPLGSSRLQSSPPLGNILDSLSRKGATNPDPFADDETGVIDHSFQLNFDADGKLMEMVEPELPPLPPPDDRLSAQQLQETVAPSDTLLPAIYEEDATMYGVEVLPDVSSIPIPGSVPTGNESSPMQVQEKEEVAPPLRRQRRRHNAVPGNAMVDENTRLPSRTVIDWADNYVERMEAERAKRRRRNCASIGKQNAASLTFGLGIMSVGSVTLNYGFSFPLADDFAGEGLKQALCFHGVDNGGSGRRRSSNEAFGDAEDKARRVRSRSNAEDEQVDHHIDAIREVAQTGDETLPETGRENAAPLSDSQHSPIIPWIRGSSQAPSSSIRSQQGTGQKPPGPRHASSPLANRGSVIQDIERFSDQDRSFAFDGVDIPSDNSFLYSIGEQHGIEYQAASNTELDDFLAYMREKAREFGASGEHDEAGVRWVNFDKLVTPGHHSRAIASQAFYQVLTLVMRDIIKVEQEVHSYEPFGTIMIGIGVGVGGKADEC